MPNYPVLDGNGNGNVVISADQSGEQPAPGEADLIRGFGQYADSRRTLVGAPLVLLPGVRTKFVCDSGFSVIERLPDDATKALWNGATSKMEPINAFDMYIMRLTLTAEGFGGPTAFVSMELDIAGAIGVIWADTRRLLRSGAQHISITIPVFSGSTFLANGGEFYLTYEGNGTCSVYKTEVMITRLIKGNG